jgi:arylformamidase
MVRESWEIPGVRLYDLSQDWSWNTPAFPTDPNPVVRWVKRLSSHGTNHQAIETTMHVGTHIDAPLHWVENARDVADMPLERLIRPGRDCRPK